MAKKPRIAVPNLGDNKPTEPQFASRYAKEFWDKAVVSCDYLTYADTAVLTMACHAWAMYMNLYKSLENSPDDGKLAGVVCKWFDRVYKLLICLGMTPAQREKMGAVPLYEGIGDGGVERRGPGGTMPSMDDEERDE
jgi:phage terminase small subunit